MLSGEMQTCAGCRDGVMNQLGHTCLEVYSDTESDSETHADETYKPNRIQMLRTTLLQLDEDMKNTIKELRMLDSSIECIQQIMTIVKDHRKPVFSAKMTPVVQRLLKTLYEDSLDFYLTQRSLAI